ncbi:hypothetical protein C8F01DRAFT_1366207 [Mycena amicta]|nr:hypothetical protein C8F01DRAFT_1366207 [Mycena amicta]
MATPPLSAPRLHETTPGDTVLFQRLLLGLIIPGALLTTGLLLLYAYAAWNPVSRTHLDRVSFRLLVHALVAHLVFCIVFPLSSLHGRPGIACEFQAFFTNSTLMYSAGMFFCVAINLPLVLALKVNGQRMEKFYLAGVAIVCLACNIPPLAAGRLGLNPANLTCWYRNAPGPTLLKWVISTQTAWMVFTSLGEVTSFVVIVAYLVGYELETRSFRIRVWRSTSRTHRSTFPTVDLDVNTRDTKPPTALPTGPSQREREHIRLFRGIVLRIGLYPLVSCLLNISTSVLDLLQSSDPTPTERIWRMNIADLTIYSSRPLVYGLLAATDPSFIRAMHALYRSDADSSSPSITTTKGQRQPQPTRVWWPRAGTRTRNNETTTGTVCLSTIVDFDYGSTSTGFDAGCEMDVLAEEVEDPRVRPPRPGVVEEGVDGDKVDLDAPPDRQPMEWLVSQI